MLSRIDGVNLAQILQVRGIGFQIPEHKKQQAWPIQISASMSVDTSSLQLTLNRSFQTNTHEMRCLKREKRVCEFLALFDWELIKTKENETGLSIRA